MMQESRLQEEAEAASADSLSKTKYPILPLLLVQFARLKK
jgi:hypothetical protein